MRYHLFALLCIAITHTSCAQPAANTANVVPPTQFRQLIQNTPDAILLDVRTEQEYAAGHIDNALNINYNSPDFKTKVAALDKSKTVLVYCAVGGRSAKSSAILHELGFQKVYDLKGGYNAWKAEK
jgi:rhodanese-related sulfurtransferase